MRNRTDLRQARTVVTCYNLLDKFLPACGVLDHSEGIYHDDPHTPYEVAQQNQIAYLLDEVKCGAGSRILDVGCGNGRLLEEVRRRGGTGVGITISPQQVDFCRRRGLDARLLNYKDIGPQWNGWFDAVVANGSMEHFVQRDEAAAERSDDIFGRFFSLMHRLINPASPVGRLVNTTIHFLRHCDPTELRKSPLSFPWKSDRFHYALLAKGFGGYYPELGQLERCARGKFELVHEVDGTRDYLLTSDEWLWRARRALRGGSGAKIIAKALPAMLEHPQQAAALILGILLSESWNWQFRGPNPPTRLLRQTWAYQA